MEHSRVVVGPTQSWQMLRCDWTVCIKGRSLTGPIASLFLTPPHTDLKNVYGCGEVKCLTHLHNERVELIIVFIMNKWTK